MDKQSLLTRVACIQDLQNHGNKLEAGHSRIFSCDLLTRTKPKIAVTPKHQSMKYKCSNPEEEVKEDELKIRKTAEDNPERFLKRFLEGGCRSQSELELEGKDDDNDNSEEDEDEDSELWESYAF